MTIEPGVDRRALHGDDARRRLGIVYMLPAGWLLPWVIGIIVLGFGIAVFRRRSRYRARRSSGHSSG